MAEEKRTRSARRTTGLAAKVVKDPAQGVGAMLLSGFLGDSTADGHTRLYLGADFDQYVDVPDVGLLHVEEPSADASPLTPALVWISRDAKLTHGSLSAAAGAGGGGTDPGQGNQFGGIPMGATIPPFCGGFPTLPPQCFPHTLPPQCFPHTLPPQCLPHTLPPLCPPPTLPLHCPPHTLPPQCVPHTVPPQCIAPTSPILCHPTFPPLCHTAPPICVAPTSPLICHHTVAPLLCPTASPACHTHAVQCFPTQTPGCLPSGFVCPSAVGCPSGPACGPGGGFPGAGGGGPAPF